MIQDTTRVRPKRTIGTKRRKEFVLANSVITLERGDIARIERGNRVEYAGPLPERTINALSEVALNG